MKFELSCCTRTLLSEIDNRRMVRRDVAKTYALALRSSEATDWPAVNRAIIDRWSPSALKWIKDQAHTGKCFGAGDENAQNKQADGYDAP